MKRTVIIGVVAVLVVVGGAAYIATKDDDKSSSSKNTSQTAGNQSANDQNNFAPASTEGLPFIATISIEGGGTTTVAKLEYDGKDKTRYTATQNNQQMQFIYTTDAYYSCTDDKCIKFPMSSSTSSGFNPSDYQYGADKLSGYRSGAAYKGKQSCSSGTCDVWSVSVDGATSTLYVDSGTKRITQVDSTQGAKTSKIVYEYKDVTIDVPANAQTLPTAP